MSEQFRERREDIENIEKKQALEDLFKALSDLLEKGVEWTAQQRQAVRQKIAGLLQILGVKSLDDVDALLAIDKQLHEAAFKVRTPEGYPNKEEFENHLKEIVASSQQRRNEPWDSSTESFIENAWTDWSKVGGRGKEISDYLYELGKVMSYEYSYTTAFDESDSIEIAENWEITNGRHRALVLKTLGTDYVEQKGIDQWITLKKEIRS